MPVINTLHEQLHFSWWWLHHTAQFAKVTFLMQIKKIAHHESLLILNLQTQAKTFKMPNFEFQRMHKNYALYFKRTIMYYTAFAVSGHFMKYYS